MKQGGSPDARLRETSERKVKALEYNAKAAEE